jgi:putative IMPACT (imprinted ancient) family translation regulator
VTDTPILCLPAASAEFEIRVRGSRFSAVTRPTDSLTGAVSAREEDRKRFHDATHHVFACRLADDTFRFDDDGEPAGTGGRPVLGAIDAAGMKNVVVVVTRHFGGTKLGMGRLARAYGSAAATALANTPVRRMVRASRVRIRYRYGDTGPISRVLEARRAARVRESFGESVELDVALHRSEVAVLEHELTQATAGRVEIEVLPDEMLLPVDT